jgi:hypothetical protein
MAAGPRPEVIEADALTAGLRRCGALGDGGRVRGVVDEEFRGTIVSRIVRVRVDYEGEAPDAPRSLIFKTALAAGRRGGRPCDAAPTVAPPRGSRAA